MALATAQLWQSLVQVWQVLILVVSFPSTIPVMEFGESKGTLIVQKLAVLVPKTQGTQNVWIEDWIATLH